MSPKAASAVPRGVSDRRFVLLAARLRRPVAIILPIATPVLAVIGGSKVAEALAGGAVVFAVIAGIAWRRAGREAREDFFASYADARALESSEATELPVVVPLLHMGAQRYVERVLVGALPGGLEGVLAHYTYVAGEKDSGEPEAHRFTIAMHALPDVTDHVLQVFCESRKSKARTGIDGFRRSNPLRLESVDLDRRYALFCGRDEDEIWLRRLFVPSFIVWLAEEPPEGFGFQLSNGYLCAFVPDRLESTAELDALCLAAAGVAERVVSEASEQFRGSVRSIRRSLRGPR